MIRLDNPVALSSRLSSAGESVDGATVMEEGLVVKEDCKMVLESSSACTLRANNESR